MVAAFIPAVRVLPPRSSSAASEAIDFARSIDFEFDEHQEEYAEAVYGWNEGTWAASDVALIEPRQNGKTGAGQVFCLVDSFLFDIECHTWTAHLFDTCRSTFNWMVATIESHRELESKLKGRIQKSAGNFGWRTKRGAETRFRARSKSGGRGVSGNVLTWDEALILPSTSAAALIPTLSAKPHTQMRFLSSQGDDSPEADLLRSLRDAARAGGGGGLAYIESASPPIECRQPRCMHVPGTRGCGMDDVSNWAAANYAMAAGRMTIASIERERRLLPPVKFGMERLGIWIDPPPVSTDERIAVTSWEETASETEVLVDGEDTVAFVDVAWDRSNTSIAFAQRDDTGRPVAQLVAYAEGTDWVGDFLRVEALNMRMRQVVMQRLSPAQSLFDELEPQRDDLAGLLDLWGASDLASACGSLLDLITQGSLLHTSDGPVTVALTAQATRVIGDGWVWDRKVPMETSKVDASPLIAMTGAIGAILRLPPPKPEFRVH